VSRSPNTLRYLDIAAGYQPLTETVGEQRAFQPTAFRQRRPAHYHACTDQVADLAGSDAWFLLCEAIAEAFEEGRWRRLPIENHATTDPTCSGMRADCACDGVQPSRVEQVVIIYKGNPGCTGFPHSAPSSGREPLLALGDPPQTRQDMAQSMRLKDIRR
jgi:hypothetical protein